MDDGPWAAPTSPGQELCHDARVNVCSPPMAAARRSTCMAPLLLADPADSIDERIKVSRYLLLDSQDALKERLARISAAYEQMHGRAL